jgi:hypothetical protein
MQVAAELVLGESRRRPMRGVSESWVGVPWLVPLPGPVNSRMMLAANDHAMRGAPRLPQDPAFASCDPDVRDGLGQAQLAKAVVIGS